MSNHNQYWDECHNIKAYLKRHGKDVDEVIMWQGGFSHDGTKMGLPIVASTTTNNVETTMFVPQDALRADDAPKWYVSPRKMTEWQETMLDKLREHYSPSTIELTSGDRLVIDGEINRDVIFYSEVNKTDYDFWLEWLIKKIEKK